MSTPPIAADFGNVVQTMRLVSLSVLPVRVFTQMTRAVTNNVRVKTEEMTDLVTSMPSLSMIDFTRFHMGLLVFGPPIMMEIAPILHLAAIPLIQTVLDLMLSAKSLLTKTVSGAAEKSVKLVVHLTLIAPILILFVAMVELIIDVVATLMLTVSPAWSVTQEMWMETEIHTSVFLQDAMETTLSVLAGMQFAMFQLMTTVSIAILQV